MRPSPGGVQWEEKRNLPGGSEAGLRGCQVPLGVFKAGLNICCRKIVFDYLYRFWRMGINTIIFSKSDPLFTHSHLFFSAWRCVRIGILENYLRQGCGSGFGWSRRIILGSRIRITLGISGSALKWKAGSGSSIESKFKTFRGLKGSHWRPWTLTLGLKIKPRRVCRPAVADSHHFDEEQDPDPHVMRIRNPDFQISLAGSGQILPGSGSSASLSRVLDQKSCPCTTVFNNASTFVYMWMWT